MVKLSIDTTDDIMRKDSWLYCAARIIKGHEAEVETQKVKRATKDVGGKKWR